MVKIRVGLAAAGVLLLVMLWLVVSHSVDWAVTDVLKV
nr:hypothetical protein ICEMyc226_00084 [Mycolicibacterium sp.]